MTRPLEGIKVLDLSRLLPGPLASLYLADMGAEVVKIEEPNTGDYLRHIPPLIGKTSKTFYSLNGNKKSVALDLKKDLDKESFLKMIKTSDVLIESFRPGTMKKLGLDYKTLSKLNSKLIYCSISGYGQDHEDAMKAGHDINYMAANGLLEQMNGQGNIQMADTAGGSLHAVIAIQAALLQRYKSNSGQYIDVSITDCTLPLGIIAFSNISDDKNPIKNQEILSGGYPFYGIYKTKDQKEMALGALEEKFWITFCDTLGKNEWKTWPNNPSRYPQYKKEISDLFASKTQAEWVTVLKEADCCCNPVRHLSEVNTLVKRSTDSGDYYECPFPIKMSSWQFNNRTLAPRLGEHNQEVLD